MGKKRPTSGIREHGLYEVIRHNRPSFNATLPATFCKYTVLSVSCLPGDTQNPTHGNCKQNVIVWLSWDPPLYTARLTHLVVVDIYWKKNDYSWHMTMLQMCNFVSWCDSGKFVSVKGTVVRVSNIKPLCTRMAFECTTCATIQVRKVRHLLMPQPCFEPNRTSKLLICFPHLNAHYSLIKKILRVCYL